MRVSAIVTTRDRPALLRRALRSIAAQTQADLELIVVDDGSAPAAAAELAETIRACAARSTLATLPPVRGGHGPSFARNHGAGIASGELLAFLDDDDEWIDPDYLARSVRIFETTPGADLLYANQEAVRPDGARVPGVVWIEDLASIVAPHAPPRPDGAWIVSPWALMQSRGFCHLNATMVSRAFFTTLDGFDVLLRYEEDRDFQLRAIDAASLVVHHPATVARHHVPERDSASTRIGPDRRVLDQLRLLDKAILTAARPEIRAHARRAKAYTLKALAQRRLANGDRATAAFYAREALAIAPGAKWLAYTAWLHLGRGRAATSGPTSA